MLYPHIRQQDPEVATLLDKELKRQREGLVMIPSENFASQAVLEATGTVLTNKYAEGYPGKRYYTGNEYIDAIEQLAIDRAKKLFNAEHVNVQPHSGSGANMACYSAVLEPGDTIMGMNLAHGGHLTHGNPVNFSGKTYRFISYGVSQENERIDMDEVRQLALKEKPKMILSGATAYPRIIDFETFANIAKEINAYAMADISHIVGLCLAGDHPNPVSSHDIVMTTTTKTLRGPRSAIILSRIEDRLKTHYHPDSEKTLAQLIDATVFPGLQGGPLEHIIAAKAVAFAEAEKPEFQEYQHQIVKNAQTLAQTLMHQGLRLVSGGTDNHLMLIDCTSLGIGGKDGANALAECGIYTNFNMIPFDTRKPFNPSGIRLGTPALTSQGMKEEEMEIIANLIAGVLHDIHNTSLKEKIKTKVLELTQGFPIYQEL
ncbi:MAG TPA: serine hydroxymethyltransferase [Candidatus Jacksonbacteria bacterium]|nr:MAG: serine hydroxymethyltransferase [Candidatus Jacksonbacteria bacterium RIFCSPHIGHO2_02_FULL_43_10]OGY71354.1 MAG: serine hydroxymethyltransferase [Candidatus Jacksonbacteria bacterium RIFCSPLOWO2_01_FULL_44_13]HAZ17019.1 serine hydroxymethyltransferase [Candidatus Jacksonbacteria bacterium]